MATTTNVLLANMGVLSTALVILLVVWAVKPKHRAQIKKELVDIKDDVYGMTKDKPKKLAPNKTIVSIKN